MILIFFLVLFIVIVLFSFSFLLVHLLMNILFIYLFVRKEKNVSRCLESVHGFTLELVMKIIDRIAINMLKMLNVYRLE